VTTTDAPSLSLVGSAKAAEDAACAHCGTKLTTGSASRFCCTGCEVVFGLFRGERLERYYDLRGDRGLPAVAASGAKGRDHKWLEPIRARFASASGLGRVTLDLQGVHCAGCVWLVDELFKREVGAASCVVNPGAGRVDLVADPAAFDLDAFVASVERFGYVFGPPRRDAAKGRGDIVWRMGVCIAIAMNTMSFGFAMYAGLDGGRFYHLLQTITLVLSLVSVLVGGPVFFRSAWAGLRRGVLHLDLPIALGILLAFGSSTLAYFTRGGASSFFDTLNVFIALMLVGRYLQERVLEKNRAHILASDGTDGLWTRLVRDGAVSVVKAKELREGDTVLLAPGDLVPVDARLTSESGASFSLDWISGESAPRRFSPNDVLPAGAFSCEKSAVSAVCVADFEASSLVALLSAPARGKKDEVARATPFWQRVVKYYVVTVLALAALGFAIWMVHTGGDVLRSLDVVTALLIVTCPCAFGIAAPLAYELAQAGLRRAGLFVRTPSFLDRAAGVKKVVFDKTGTLTTGGLTVADRAPIDALDAADRAVLYDMVTRSAHPKSAAIAAALGHGQLDALAKVTEIAGAGLVAEAGGRSYRLGAPGWAAEGEDAGGADVVFSKDGRVLAALTTREELRADAAREVRELEQAGFETWVLSGDSPERARAVAAECGIEPARAVGAETPEGKRAWLAARDHGDCLFVGDGINDSLVAESATCSGTPAIDRPFMAARSDFYFVTPGLRPVRLALAVAERLNTTTRLTFGIAVAYNVVTVALSYAGVMSPLVCAIVMPLSSLTTVLAVTASLSNRSRTWTS